NVNAGQITSSPGPIPIASSAITSASVPFATPIVCGTPRNPAASSSKAFTFGPRMKTPASSTSARRSFSSGRSGAYCALTSTSGIGRTASESSRAPAQHEPCRGSDDGEPDRVVDEPEVAVEALPAPADRPADAGGREAPDRRANERQDRVRGEPHPEDARRDRDERADDGRDSPQEDSPVAPPVEPALGPVELLRREVEDAPAILEQRPAAVGADPPADDRAGEIADRAGERHREERPEGRRDPRSEERHVLGRERAGRERAGVDHDELARRREDRVDRHQGEDGVQTVVADEGGDRPGDARDEHRRSLSARDRYGLAQVDGAELVRRGHAKAVLARGRPHAVRVAPGPSHDRLARLEPRAR